MRKEEYIERYGEEWYQEYRRRCRAYNKKRYAENEVYKEHLKEYRKQYLADNKEKVRKHHTEYCRNRKLTDYNFSLTLKIDKLHQYCNEIELIENYDKALADNFIGWHCHHRLENYWSKATLKKKNMYYKVNPESLIFLTSEEHSKDYGKSTIYPLETKWHKRLYEV